MTQSEWIFVSTSRELNCVFLRTKGALKAKLLNDISFSDDEYITDIRPIVFTLDFNNHSINSSNYTLHCYPYGTDGDIGGNVSLLNGTVNTNQFQTNARYNSIFNLENMTFNGYVSFACKTTNIKNVKVQKPKDYDVNIYFWSDCKEVNIENLEMSGTSVSFGSYSQPMNVTISGNVLTDSYVDLSGNTSFVFKNGASWVSTYDGSKEWSPYCFNLKNQSEERCATLSGYKDNTTECGLFTDEDMTVPFEMDTLDEISAVYARPLKNYTVTWKNDDGTLIDTTQAKEGTAPAYDGNESAKDGYVFAGWKDDNDTFYAKGTELPNVTANAVYTAAFGKEIAVGTEFYIGDIFNTNGSKSITLVGADYTEKADYEFTWADNCQSATVVFNSEEPVNAVVTIKTDSDGNTIYTAAAVYNGITYIETKTVNVGEQDGFEYVIVEGENKITITKYNGSAEEVTIPEEINGIPVTAIGNEAFKNNAILKDVIIPLNIEKIGKDAFAGCSEELNIHGYRRTDSERYATENEINFIAIPYPLENASTISSDHADINEQIKVTGAGVEGTLSYKYAVYYKPADSETWTTRQGYSENNVITLTFTKGGTYDICVKVKDTAGSVEKKYFKVAVTRPLANTSKISANAITLGDSFVVDMSAKDGSGTYEYAVETKHISEKEWTTVSDYSDKESVTVTPDKAGAQNIRVSVKDSFGNINKKSFIVDVQNVKPNNNSTISATDIKVGESLTVNCNAELGAGSFRYAVYQKALEAEKWTTVQNFAENPEVKTTFKKPGLYQICAKAIDADKTITKKYFTVNVTKDTLINNSAISADSVTAGESIDITAAAEGGFGTFTYAVYYKLSESSKWTVVQKFTDNDKVTITPAKAGRYDICVKVSDETGEIVKKYFMAEVKHQQLVNKCTISADTIRQGESIIVTANAENGSGSYQYAVYLKSTEKTAWNTVQDFSEQSEITVKPKNKGDYDICMKVMDSDGTIAKIYTSVYVK